MLFLVKEILLDLYTFLKENLQKFCKVTSLHGINYLSKIDTKAEKYFWCSISALSIIVSVFLLLLLGSWNGSHMKPNIVIESMTYDTSKINFPAITICNTNLLSRSKALKFAQKLTRPNNMSVLAAAHLFKSILPDKTYQPHRQQLKNLLYINNISVGQLLHEIQPNCREYFKQCTWEAVKENCSALFQPVLLDALKSCCTTNYFAYKSNSGYDMKLMNRVVQKPIHTYGADYGYGISLILTSSERDVFARRFPFRGFLIYIHNPYEVPSDGNVHIVGEQRINWLRFYPSTTYATEYVKALSPESRLCLLVHEHKFLEFEQYTLKNCLSNCSKEWHMYACNCQAPHFLPNPLMSNCSFEQYICFLEKQATSFQTPMYPNKHCPCLPECEKVNYDVSLSTARLIDPKQDFYNRETIVHLFFGDKLSKRYRRDVSDWFQILSAYGGVLSLLMGFSIVSIFELIYIFIFQPDIQ